MRAVALRRQRTSELAEVPVPRLTEPEDFCRSTLHMGHAHDWGEMGMNVAPMIRHQVALEEQTGRST